MKKFLFLAVAALFVSAPARAADVFFLDTDYALVPVHRDVADFESAAAELVKGPNPQEKARGLQTAIPLLTRISSIKVENGKTIVDLSGPWLDTQLPDRDVDAIFQQFDYTSRAFGVDAHLRFNGKTSQAIRIPEIPVEPQPVPLPSPFQKLSTGTLAPRRITVSAGHGYYWTGTRFTTQRGITCGDHIQEDFRNVFLARYLKSYLEADGAVVVDTREMNLDRGNHPVSNLPWWQMCAPFYLYDRGYPMSVFSPITQSIPGDPNFTTTQVDDDRRSRPEASNYDSTDMFLSIHTNAFQGNCYGTSCPTGIEMFADATQLGGFFQQSLSLGQKTQTAIYSAVRTTYDAAYPCRNNCTPRTGSAFTEIHYPRRPAVLVEVGFHDSCDTDVVAQKDPVYMSSAMWGFYKGVCDYYGVPATWPLRSYEIVSAEFPALVKGGDQFTSRITLRNRGCVWTQAHQFQLASGFVSDPFTPLTRIDLPTDEIDPGEEVTFEIAMTAPATDGPRTSRWRMIHGRFNAFFGAPVNMGIYVDAAPPSSPAPVNDGGPFQTSTTHIQASWKASVDPGSGLKNYWVRVIDENDTPVTLWLNPGTATSFSIPVSLQPGKTYRVLVKAMDNFGFETEPAVSPGVTVLEPVSSIGQAKMLPDGSPVALEDKIVSKLFANHLYIQEPARSSGIRVNSTAAQPGQVVNVMGSLTTTGGERAIANPSLAVIGGSQVPEPLTVSIRALGGEDFGLYTPGTDPGVGLNTLGLLVKVYGLVGDVQSSGFRLGPGQPGLLGIWVEAPGLSAPASGSFATVTGISAVKPSSTEPAVKPSSQGDIVPD